MTKTKMLAAFEVYALYLLTGAACITIGSSMTQLIAHYGVSLAAVATLGSAFALGRVVTVSLMGVLVEKLGPKPVLALGISLLLVFFLGLPATKSYPLALAFSALGGVGFGTQDATGPVVVSGIFTTGYASAMSAGQACFGAGCFLPPLCMSIVLSLGLPFQYTYLVFAMLAVLMLAVLPFAGMPKTQQLAESGGHAANPLYLTARVPGWVLLGVFAVSYCAVVNTINLYTTTFAESLAIPGAIAVSMLTAYNVGSMLGSLLFIVLLRRLKPLNVLWVNVAVALGLMLAAVLLQSIPVFFAALFLTGFFIGVLFSVMITLATGLEPRHAGFVAGIVGMVCGGSDTITPLITGRLVTAWGPGSAYWYAIAMLAIALLAAAGFRALCRTGNKAAG
ncbi:MAG: hypothetical protein PWQ08_492 [Clostridiales bacterium]|nr:hypothetical protein [Clostridiales bacterium]